MSWCAITKLGTKYFLGIIVRSNQIIIGPRIFPIIYNDDRRDKRDKNRKRSRCGTKHRSRTWGERSQSVSEQPFCSHSALQDITRPLHRGLLAVCQPWQPGWRRRRGQQGWPREAWPPTVEPWEAQEFLQRDHVHPRQRIGESRAVAGRPTTDSLNLDIERCYLNWLLWIPTTVLPGYW